MLKDCRRQPLHRRLLPTPPLGSDFSVMHTEMPSWHFDRGIQSASDTTRRCKGSRFRKGSNSTPLGQIDASVVALGCQVARKPGGEAETFANGQRFWLLAPRFENATHKLCDPNQAVVPFKSRHSIPTKCELEHKLGAVRASLFASCCASASLVGVVSLWAKV